ncbi:MAG: hypothetical protein RBQ94_05955 [Methanimicrococcus sp.]|nr:hypothetical protein [Methanimicrococcus sp.]
MTELIDPKFKENVYSTVCYGCGFGCGVYMRELETKAVKTGTSCGAPILNIDYRKVSPVNQGKLCRFGVQLASHYCPAVSSVEGKAVSTEEAVLKAGEILKKTSPSHIALLSIGGTTNEEHLAFMKIGEKLGTPANTGMTGLFKDIGKLHAYTGRDATYDDVETAKKIYLFADPYVSYPLLIRRLVHAKQKGAEIVSFGLKELPIASQNVILEPDASLYDLSEFKPDEETVVVSDLTPYTHAKRLAELVELAGNKSKFLFMRPFMNATGVGYLSKHTKQQSFDDIVSQMETGDLKVLVCLDSDLIDICLNENIRETFKNLEHVIAISSRDSSICGFADVVIATEPFYKKKGSVMNSEGRLIQTKAAAGEMPQTGFKALSDLLTAVGGSALDFEAVSKEAVSMLGASVDEYKILAPERKSAPEIKKISDQLPDLKTTLKAEGDSSKDAIKHVYLPTPFLWNGVVDNDNYIELSRCQVKDFSLLKGFTADVKCDCGEITKTTRFKVSPMADGYAISMRKQPFAKAFVTNVVISRSLTKPNEPEIVKECNIPQ